MNDAYVEEVIRLRKKVDDLEYELKCIKGELRTTANALMHRFRMINAEAKIIAALMDGMPHSHESLEHITGIPYDSMTVHCSHIRATYRNIEFIKHWGYGRQLTKDSIIYIKGELQRFKK